MDNKKEAASKSGAKAAGLKSAFVLGKGEVLITSFGKGNDAVREKRVVNGKMENIASKPALRITPADDKGKYSVSGRVFKDAKEDDPLRRRATEENPSSERVKREREAAEAKAAAEKRMREEKFRIKMEGLRAEGKRLPKACRKSSAKAAGLKSVLVVKEDELLLTSFGRGNAAIPEKSVVGDEIKDLQAEPNLKVTGEKERFTVNGRVTRNATSDNPLWQPKNTVEPRPAHMDLLDSKDKLEMRFFGKTFEDNIHIQLIHNILDIDKILTVHINNVVYELNNMLRTEDKDYDEFIGYLTGKPYETFMNPDPNNGTAVALCELFTKLMSRPQLSYFGTVLRDDAMRKKARKADGKRKGPGTKLEEEIERQNRNAYALLCCLGSMRQSLAHGGEGTISAIYNPFPEKQAFCGAALHRLYTAAIHDLNEGFLEKANKDLVLLFRLFGADNAVKKKELVREYYDFIVCKNYKNLGFSVKALREAAIAEYAPEIKDKQYDSVRAKLNHCFDFMVHMHYKASPERVEKLVAELRAVSTEPEKEAVYLEEAAALWNAIGKNIRSDLLPKMNGDYIKVIGTDPDITPEMIEDIAVRPEASPFAERMYLLTVFQDGKEINNLLTTLIHSFENIDSFLEVMKYAGLDCAFEKEWAMFAESGKIAKELRLINSFARMHKPAPEAKQILYVEAAEVLGYKQTPEQIEAYVQQMLDPKKGPTGYNGKKDKSVRNFIANNVIESDRFKYLVRYANPKRAGALAANEKVIRFVLKDIPDTQILRYFNSCTGSEYKECTADMRPRLCKMIGEVNLGLFSDIPRATFRDSEANVEREKKKAVVRLYLTVLYLLTKNLVYINSRYFLAFHCVERDAILYDSAYKKCFSGREKDFARFAREFVPAHTKLPCYKANPNPPENARLPINRRAYYYIMNNMEKSDTWAIRSFRNSVEHLNAVRNASSYIGGIKEVNSYFGLYHYLLQRSLKDQYEYEMKEYNNVSLTGKTKAYFDLVEKYGTYCKDFVKALNVPFAYNLPRYKNLSIEALFDKNIPLPKDMPKEVLDEIKLRDQAEN